MAPSDSRPYPAAVICSGRQSLRPDASDRRIQPGLSGSSQIFRRPLSPLTPGSPSAAYARCFTDGVWFHLLRKADHCHWFHEAETGSLTLRLTSSPSRAPTTWLPTPPPSQLHGERAIAMISTFQLTRSTRISLTDRRERSWPYRRVVGAAVTMFQVRVDWLNRRKKFRREE
jgi:hypothetical protein